MLAESDSCLSSNVCKRSVPIIAKENAWGRIAGDVDVGPPVAIQVGGYGCKGIEAFHRCHTRARGDILKRQIAPIVVKGHRSERKAAGAAENRHALPFAVGSFARKRRSGQIEGLVAGDKQVQPAVSIVIKKGTTGTPLLRRQRNTAPRSDVFEGAVAAVAVEHVRTPVSDVEIEVAVVVHVPCANSRTPAGARQAGFPGYVDKPVHTGVTVQVVGRRLAVAVSLQS